MLEVGKRNTMHRFYTHAQQFAHAFYSNASDVITVSDVQIWYMVQGGGDEKTLFFGEVMKF